VDRPRLLLVSGVSELEWQIKPQEGTRLGAEERSAIDSPRRRRATHLATVLLLTPAACAARA
jgi:hypothetical protein